VIDPVVAQVLARGRVVPWIGRVWRLHEAIWSADDPGGSLVVSGRWNQGRDFGSGADAFPVLYSATAPGVADWEFLRHSKLATVDAIWRRFVRVRRSWLDVSVPSVLDLRDPGSVGLQPHDLLSDDPGAYALPQAISSTAYARGLSGLLVPTATTMGQASGDYNVIVFYELTGATRTVHGFVVPETVPRNGIVVAVAGSETPNLGAGA
jgi:RES domain-containing protein